MVGADYDVLHGHYPISMLPVLTTRIPYLYTFHAPVYKEVVGERQGSYRAPGPVSDATVTVMKAIERRVLERATTVVTLSDFVGARDARHHPSRARRPGRRSPAVCRPTTSRRGPGASHRSTVGRPLIVTARRLVERTGVELLVAAMPEILRAHPPPSSSSPATDPDAARSRSSSRTWASPMRCTCSGGSRTRIC